MKMKSSVKVLAGGIVAAAFMAMSPAGPVTVQAGDEVKNEMPVVMDINLQKQCPGIKGLPKDKKSVKGFTHEKHATQYLMGKEKFSKFPYTDEFTCTACHTGAASAEAITAENACKAMEEELEKEGGAKKMANHFHNTCKACHKAMKKAGEKSGPTSCKGCHG